MLKITAPIALVALLLLCCAPDTLAHGGQYRGPGGSVPPGQREPEDPTPAPPPPPSGPPVTPPPTTGPSGPSPQPSNPTEPPTTPAPTPTEPSTGGGRPRGQNTIGMDSWMFWYEYNKARLQNLKRAIYAEPDTSHPFIGMGQGGHTTRSGSTQMARSEIDRLLIPALRWAMDPKNAGHQDTESAAYIALAKVTNDPADIEQIQKGIDSKNYVTAESTALALGLLRRERPSDQFDAATLDKVRSFLFAAIENDEYRIRTRGFAALALGLLGDQPSGSDRYAGGAKATTGRLFELLRRSYKNPNIHVALLVAISMQSPDTIGDEHRGILRTCASKGRLHKDDVQNHVRQFAALALGRLSGRGEDVLFLQRLLTQRRTSANVRRSVAIALGEVAARVSAEERVRVAKTLLDALRKKKLRDASARNFALISLAYLVAADVDQGRTDVIGSTKVGARLLSIAEDGTNGTRPFGALALGLICRAIGDEISLEVYGDYQAQAREVLRAGLAGRKIDTRERGAFAIALGIAHDNNSVKELTDIVRDRKLDQELRGYAALALGHIGLPQRPALDALRTAMKQRTSEALRRSTATALGMLKDREAVDLLVKEMRLARTVGTQGQIVIALARIGDERAVAPLVELMKNKEEHDLTRALACAGLGIVGDLEWMPSLSLLSDDINYRAAGDVINEALSIF